jgi:hypothetical protein
MENMDNKFKGYDSEKQRESANAYRLSELKNKLMYSAERELRSFLSSEGIDGVKVNSTRVEALDINEDEETGAPIFTGEIIANVAFYDKGIEVTADLPVNILASQPSPHKENIREALKSATAPEVEVEAASSSQVTASLSSFKVTDDGSRYLKIYHTAAYGDLEPIGAVSKEEYEDINHEELLTEMFKDEASSWPADVSWEGEFTEPEIVAAIVTDEPQYVVHAFGNHPACENPSCKCDPCTPSEPCPCGADESELTKQADDGKYVFTTTDSTRIALEAEEKNYDALQTRLQQRAVATFTDVWKSKHLGNMNISNSSIEYNEASGQGEVTIEAEVLDGKDNKLVPFTVGFSGSSMTMPDLTDVTSLLKDAPVIKVADNNQCKGCKGTGINKEAACDACDSTGDETKRLKKAPAITKEASLEKEATPMSPNNTGYQEVLRMPKDFLPATLKEGDVIDVDGLKWKLSSKSEGQLSKERDTGSHWTFLRCANDEDSSYRQDSY